MGCGCGKRAVAILKGMGYEQVDDLGRLSVLGEWLRKGDKLIHYDEVEQHHASITAGAVLNEIKDTVSHLITGGDND